VSAEFTFAPLEPAPAPPTNIKGLSPNSVGGQSPNTPEVDVEAIAAEARAEGYAAGAADARAAYEPAAEALRAVVAELEGQRGELAVQGERAAVDLALRIAEQVVQAAVAADPERVLDVVRGAMRRLVERERIIVLVSPDDLDVVRDHMTAITAELGGVEHYAVESDRRVGRGGAVIRTADGEVDASLDSKLARVREVLDGELTG
jgi:flagellar assembly protein FliH